MPTVQQIFIARVHDVHPIDQGRTRTGRSITLAARSARRRAACACLPSRDVCCAHNVHNKLGERAAVSRQEMIARSRARPRPALVLQVDESSRTEHSRRIAAVLAVPLKEHGHLVAVRHAHARQRGRSLAAQHGKVRPAQTARCRRRHSRPRHRKTSRALCCQTIRSRRVAHDAENRSGMEQRNATGRGTSPRSLATTGPQ